LSAPHGREAKAVRQVTAQDAVRNYVREVRQAISIPLAVKLTAQADDPLLLAETAMTEGADMVVLTGRVQGFMPDIETQQPILGSWGAIGGPWSLPSSLYWVSKFRRNVSKDFPIIGTNGARSAGDVIRFLLSGAHAVEMASAVMTSGPGIFPQSIRGIQSYCRRKQISRISEIIGKAADCALRYEEIKPTICRTHRWPY